MESTTSLVSDNRAQSDKLLNLADNATEPMSAEKCIAISDRLIKQLESVKRSPLDEMIEQRLTPYIVDMTKPMPDIEPLISINGSCVCSRGNISAICGEAKSKKTFLTSALVASAMAIPLPKLDNFKTVAKNPLISVLWVDTEQGEQHVRRVVSRISQMTGGTLLGEGVEPRLTTLALRELSPRERKNMLYDAMRLGVYDIVVIDGVADLQNNTNDLAESDALVSELMALSTKANTHIICVLHTNPGSDKARGHLGSSLQRKAESVLFVHRADECSIVEPQFCRNEPFERFAFCVSEEGIPQLCDMPTFNPERRNNEQAIVEDLYGGVIERKTLVNKLMDSGYTNVNAQMRIKRAIDKGLLFVDGDRVVSANYVPHPTKQAEPFGRVEQTEPTATAPTVSAPAVTEATVSAPTLMPLPEPAPPKCRHPHDEWEEDYPF